MRGETCAEIATGANLSQPTIRRWAAAGLLPTPTYVPFGRARKVGIWPVGTTRRARSVHVLTAKMKLTWPQAKALVDHWLTNAGALTFEQQTEHLEKILLAIEPAQIREIVLDLLLPSQGETP